MQITKKLIVDATPMEIIYWVLAIVAFFISIYVFAIGWHNPIVDLHAFRQTQTALSSFWMIKEGGYLNYQTPVLGYPWSIPMEFPLYQWLAVVLYKLSFLKLDQCGRLISILAFYATLFPIHILLKKLDFKIIAFKIFTCLFLLSPIYLFWSRTFMIESLSLFLAISFLALAQSYFNKKNPLTAFTCIIIGCLAALTKITTFVPAAVFYIGLVLIDWHKNYSFSINKKTITNYLITAVFILIPLTVSIMWVNYTDHIKALHPVGSFLTSEALSEWNFGTMGQKFSLLLWINAIFLRSFLYESLGCGVALLILLVHLCTIELGTNTNKTKSKNHTDIKIVLLSIATYLSAFLIFTNLYIEHNYYGCANAIYIILAAALVLYIIYQKLSPTYFIILMVIIMTIQIKTYGFTYMPHAKNDTFRHRDYLVALFVKEHTKPNDFVLVHGIDWASTIAYYSERKSLTRNFTKTGDYVERLQNINKYSGGLRLGAIVICPANSVRPDDGQQEIINKTTQNYTKSIVANCEVFHLD